MGASSGTTSLSYNPASQASLILVSQPTVDHAKAQGRIAFSIPGSDLPGVEAKEICFVGSEAFRELSQVDPEADNLLDAALAGDKSNEWFAKKGRAKVEEA